MEKSDPVLIAGAGGVVGAAIARKLGSSILTMTMERRPGIGFDSYDRLFPNQDTLPRGGFGNLIALPLQKKARARGSSVFLDDRLVPYEDQWSYLSTVRKLRRGFVEEVVGDAERKERVLGVRLAPPDPDDALPWATPQSGGRLNAPVTGPLPGQLNIVLGSDVFIPKSALSSTLRIALVRLAAFQNPEFYKAQAMRLPTYGKPRIIGCAEDHSQHIGLPRGCLNDIMRLLGDLKIEPVLHDKRCQGEPLCVAFCGELRPEQQAAADAMLAHDTGVLDATTAFGKTVIAAWLIAQRSVNTLVQRYPDRQPDRLCLRSWLPFSGDAVSSGRRHGPGSSRDHSGCEASRSAPRSTRAPSSLPELRGILVAEDDCRKASDPHHEPDDERHRLHGARTP